MHSRRSHQVWMQRKHVSCYNLHNTLTRKQTEAKQELEGEARRGISGAGPTAKREDFGRKEEKVKSGLGKWFFAPTGALYVMIHGALSYIRSKPTLSDFEHLGQ